MALVYTPTAALGTRCPDYSLTATDGRVHSLRDRQTNQAFLIMFICNHCPYVKAIEDRLIELAMELRHLDIATIAISSNDAVSHPEDSLVEMTKRAREKSYPFPYLYDADQSVAKKFGAVCTPDFFLYDRAQELFYRGRLDDAWKDPARVKNRELLEAARRLSRGEAPPEEQIPSMGCSIKWVQS